MQTSTLRVLRVQGEPRERGRQHGEELRPLIHEGMERWTDTLQRMTGLPAHEYLDQFLAATNFTDAIERHCPDLLQEVRGIAEGAGVPFPEMYAYQLVDEEWLYRSDLLRAHRQEHCSAMGLFARSDGPPIVAQNMDIPSYYDGTQVLLHLSDPNTDLEVAVLTPAGLIATTGLNNRGVAICCNTLADLSHAYSGLPVAFVVRSVLNRASRPDAVHFATEVRHASGQNYTIGGPDGVTDLECSSNQMVEFHWQDDRVCHTNHPLANDDRHDTGNGISTSSAMAESTVTIMEETNSQRRMRFLQENLGDSGVAITPELAMRLLSAAEPGICVPRNSPTGGLSWGSVVFELSCPPIAHIAPGPPDVTPYETFTFD